VKILDLFVTGTLSLTGAKKYPRQTLYRLFFPHVDLIGMNTVSGRNLLYRPVTAQSFKRYLGI